MAKLPFDEKENRKGDRVISVANLPRDLIIDNPRTFLREMRSTFLKKVREGRGLRKEEVSQKCGIPISKLEDIESGKIGEQEMMILHILSEIYELDYPSLLFLYRLANRPERITVDKLAAYHKQDIDSATQQELLDFLGKLKDSLP
jgi:transcriptional regulator with XRE-family HTH domain